MVTCQLSGVFKQRSNVTKTVRQCEIQTSRLSSVLLGVNSDINNDAGNSC